VSSFTAREGGCFQNTAECSVCYSLPRGAHRWHPFPNWVAEATANGPVQVLRLLDKGSEADVDGILD
jgi:hypothetical protein